MRNICIESYQLPVVAEVHRIDICSIGSIRPNSHHRKPYEDIHCIVWYFRARRGYQRGGEVMELLSIVELLTLVLELVSHLLSGSLMSRV